LTCEKEVVPPSGIEGVGVSPASNFTCEPCAGLSLCQSTKHENDIDIMNFALYVERLIVNFYNTLLGNFTLTDFTDEGFSELIYNKTLQIKDQHVNGHLPALASAVSDMGGNPVVDCVYNFTTGITVTQFFLAARNFELIAVNSYNAQINLLGNSTAQALALSMDTVCSRHVGWFSDRILEDPFPLAFDSAFAPNRTLSLTSSNVISCPFTLKIPLVVECN